MDHLAAITYGPDALARRRVARRAAAAVHALGVVVPFFLMVSTEGSGASWNPAKALTEARVNLAVVLVVAVAQAVTLLVWGRWHRLARAGGARNVPVTATDSFSRRISQRERGERSAIKVCVALVFASAWIAEAGYLVQAVTSMGNVYGEDFSDLTFGLLLIAVVLGFACGLTAGIYRLSARTGEAMARDSAIAMGLPSAVRWSAPGAGQPAGVLTTGVRVAALARMSRRASVFIVVGCLIMAGIVALGADVAASGNSHLTIVRVAAYFVVDLCWVVAAVRSRRSARRRIKVLREQEHAQPVA